MRVENLSHAMELQAELTAWQQAKQRLNPGVFKEAMLRVVDMAHGINGQIGETIIRLTSADLIPFADQQIAGIITALHELGVEM